MNRYDERLIAMDWHVRTNSTIRAAIAVVDAANTGVLAPTVAKEVHEYLEIPYAYYYGEKKLSLMNRFITHPEELHTKSGLLNVLNLIEIAGGYVNKTIYGGFTPKGVKYGHIKPNDAFFILMNVPKNHQVVEKTGGIVAYSDDYSYEEHELFVGV